jgi:hypothetical protein
LELQVFKLSHSEVHLKMPCKPNEVSHAWNLNTQKAETERSRVPGQPGLHRDFKDNLTTQ